MSMPDTEKPIRTIPRRSGGNMWCETCNVWTTCAWTTTKFFKNGRQIDRQKCSECDTIQEVEFFKGPTTRIKNKK